MTKLKGKKIIKKTQAKSTSKVSDSLLRRVKENQRRAKSSPSFFKDGLDLEFYKPEEGQHDMDIIPFIMGDSAPIYRGNPVCEEGEYDYVLDFWAHFGLGSTGKQACICLNRTYERKCPICEYVNELRLEGRDDEADDIKAKRRVLYNVVSYDKGEESKGVQILSCSYHYMEKFLLKLAKRPVRAGRENVEPFINFASTDAGEGKSINFDIEKGTKGSYDEWIGHSFVDRDYDISQDILEQAHQLDQLLYVPSYEEADNILKGVDSSDSDDTEQEDEPEKPVRTNRTTAKPKPKTTGRRTARPKVEPDPEPDPEPEGEEVLEEEQEEETEVSEGECPYDHEFGVEIQDFDECEGCEAFDACFEAYQALQGEGEQEPEEEPEPDPPPTRRDRTTTNRRGKR